MQLKGPANNNAGESPNAERAWNELARAVAGRPPPISLTSEAFLPVSGSMRFVEAPACDSSLPGRYLLDRARSLASRFPAARLREVSVVRAPLLDAKADPTGQTNVWLALEGLQVTGSFKVRGALLSIAAHSTSAVVTASAGNHGIGVAYAAGILGVSSTIVVPEGVSFARRQKMKGYGAEVIISASPRMGDADELAREIARSQQIPFISANEDELAAVGNGTSLGYEIVLSIGGIPDRVIVPIGAGGLATGLSWAFADESEHPGDPRVRPVCGVQSESSCAMARSLETGKAVQRFELLGPTFADALTGGVSEVCYQRVRGAVAGIFVVGEELIAEAMAFAFREQQLVLEGGAAVALCPVLGGLPEELRGGDVVVVLTGRNVEEERFHSIIRPFGSRL